MKIRKQNSSSWVPNQEDEIPQQLESLENNIEKVILTLDGPAIELKKRNNKIKEKKAAKRNKENKAPKTENRAKRKR